jgi:tetratricopeptide (TPR) repeat protein
MTAEWAADVALGQAEQAAGQARGIDEEADKVGNVEPETPETAAHATTLWRQALGWVEEAERALAAAPDATAARGRLAARKQVIEAGVERAVKEARLLNDLDRARALRVTWRGSGYDIVSAARTYGAAFNTAYGPGTGEAKGLAEALRAERPAVRLALIVALDDWASMLGKSKVAARLRTIADGADADPWRRRYRAAASAGDVSALKHLADEARGQELPGVSADLLAAALINGGARAEAAALLRQARRQHPADFWIHLDFGSSLFNPSHPDPTTLSEAAGGFWAAIALRPDSAPALGNLGVVLDAQGDREGAVACYKKAIELDPKYSLAHYNLGTVLLEKGDWNGAAECLRKSIEIDPSYAPVHVNLGDALRGKGDLDGAVACYKKAIELDPKLANARVGLGMVLGARSDPQGAAACFRKAIELDSRDAAAHGNLGLLLLDEGNLDGAANCFRKAIELNPRLSAAHGSLGLVLWRKGDLNGAVVCIRKAIELDAKNAAGHYTLGLVLRDQGKLDEAVAEFREAVRLGPFSAASHDQLGWSLRLQGKLDEALTHCSKAVELQPHVANLHNSLAYVLWDQGRLDEAIAEFREAVRLDPHFADASANLAKAEKMAALQVQLPGLQKGEFKPRTNDELAAMSRLCEIKKLFLASARMYAEAFAADPKLADDAPSSNRYSAACDAARAGRGEGVDAKELDDKERARWRKQALDWLRADLVLWEKRVGSDKPEERKQVAATLRHWQEDADLSGLRDAAELAKLPADEQEACKKLWVDVKALLEKANAKK